MSLDNGSSPLMSQPECRRKARAIQEPLEIDSDVYFVHLQRRLLDLPSPST